MPIYDYACRSCGHRFEVRQSFSDEPLTICSRCGGSLYRVLYPPLGIHFKGTGWHSTDYRSNNNTNNHRRSEEPKEEPAKEPASKPAPASSEPE
jgi:putative FmdB family regulatory protein